MITVTLSFEEAYNLSHHLWVAKNRYAANLMTCEEAGHPELAETFAAQIAEVDDLIALLTEGE